jgi:predicted HTH transcriptional regulator
MNILISILGGVVAGIIIGFFLWRERNGSLMSVFDSARTSSRMTLGQGIIKEQAEVREKNLAKMREFIAGKDRITNDQIQKYLNVSNSSTARYLDQLEKEGLIKQVGETGKYAYYEVIR